MKYGAIMRFVVLIIFICVTVVSAQIHDTASIENDYDEGAVNAKKQFNSGFVSGVFTKDDGPFLIKGDIIIPSQEKLEFGPGSVIYVGGSYTTITVYGQFVAKGTAREQILIRSARKKSKPWDWDRIYCRSFEPSVFEYCEIRNSNYGLTVENGNVSIRNSRFANNSINALYVKQSEVTVTAVTIDAGHVCGINLQAGARVNADSLVINQNKTGILCGSNSSLRLNYGSIKGNSNGIVADKDAFVAIVAANITGNKFGVVSNTEIPGRMREMVFNNYNDVKIVNNDEIDRIVMSETMQKRINETDLKSKLSQTGFSALSIPREPNSSFIGNVVSGFTLYKPQSVNHPRDMDSVSGTPGVYVPVMRKQTRYLGEQSEHWYGGLQPELQLFINGKRGAADVNMILDLYGNEWLSTSNYVRKNIFNLSMNYAQQSLIIGDFYENGSETSISGRAMTGMKYSGGFLEMGGGVKRIGFGLCAGESEIPKDSGDHELNIFNSIVDSSQSVRQQITYVAAVTVKPLTNTTVSLKGIIARDQADEPLLRKKITDTAVTDPLEAQTGVLDIKTDLSDGKIAIGAELDLGSSDTLTDVSTKSIKWYNPEIGNAVSGVFSLFKENNFSDHYAGSTYIKALIHEYTAVLSFSQIAGDYFSAGNPYLETDKREVMFNIELPSVKGIQSFGEIKYERTSMSIEPIDRGTLEIAAEYTASDSRPSASVSYTGIIERCNKTERDSVVSRTFHSLQLNNLVSIEGKQALKNGLHYSIRYQFLIDKDLSDHLVKENNGIGDRFQHTWNAMLGFKVKRFLRNKATFRIATRDENRDSLRAVSWRYGDQITIDIIKSRLSLKLNGEYSSKKEEKTIDGLTGTIKTKLYNINADVKYSFTPKLSFNVQSGYEKSYDENTGSTDNYSLYQGGLHFTVLF
jgi:Periplasmic copper-binding protein (NosD)